MRVAMIGATGLIGRSLWPLLEREHDLLVLSRRPSGARNERIGPLERWPDLLAGEQIDAAVCAVGTTWKKAGSWEAFARIDQYAQTSFAQAAHQAGARHFLTVSSSGANPGSRNRYLRLKGEVEQELAAIGFDRLDIVRPGLLLGDRPGDRRFLERLGILTAPLFNPFLRGPLDRYAGIEATTVATAMASLASCTEPGHFVHHNRELRELTRT